MKIELALFAVLAFVANHVSAMLSPSALLTIMGGDMAKFKLPPKPPAILTQPNRNAYRRQHMTRQMQRQRMAMAHQAMQAKARAEREHQEMALFQRMREMPAAEVKKLKERLSVTQLRQLVERLRHLVAEEKRNEAATTSPGSTAAPNDPTAAATGVTSHPNHVLSAANKIKRPTPSSPATSAAQRARMSASIRARAMAMRRRYAARVAAQKKATSRRPKNPLDAIKKYQKYQKDSLSALAAGCLPPMGMDSMNSFFAFNRGGCRGGGMAVCAMAGQSCVDLGASITCCPPGFTSGTLDIMNYMKQMDAFMAQF